MITSQLNFESKLPFELNLKDVVKLFLQPNYWLTYLKLQGLLNTPRYTSKTISISGKKIRILDSASFLYMYREIFEKQIYRFETDSKNPLIIDAGANIGLSVIYLKELYPNSKVIAFEPDSRVFEVLKANVENSSLTGVELVKKALWSSETTLEFLSEGSDGGRMVNLEDDSRKVVVETVRLRDFLDQPVDFLKIDIEGAETEVLRDVQDLLPNVSNLFVEYHSFADNPQTLSEVIEIITNAGFRLHICPCLISPQPLFKRTIYCGMDMQLNLFAFRK
jgi:FkbM family methyltransferase